MLYPNTWQANLSLVTNGFGEHCGWTPPDVPTGIGFVDDLLDGGLTRGEVGAILSTIGGGRTALAVQITIALARQFHLESQNSAGPHRVCYYVAYDETENEMTQRLVACAAEIPFDLLYGNHQFSRAGTLKNYELQRFGGSCDRDGNYHPGELERVNSARSLVERFVRVLRLSGDPPMTWAWDPTYGIEQDFQRDFQGSEWHPGFLVVDDALIPVRNHVMKWGADPKSLSKMLAEFPQALLQKIAEPRRIPVLLTQFIAPRYGELGPTAPMSHKMAAETRKLGDSVDYCLCLGNRDRSSDARLLHQAIPRLRPTIAPKVVAYESDLSGFCADNAHFADLVRDRVCRRASSRACISEFADSLPAMHQSQQQHKRVQPDFRAIGLTGDA